MTLSINGSTGAGGGGASVPSGDAGDVVTLDGAGALSALAQRTLLGRVRRPAPSATTRLLYELVETSGDALNTGSLGAAGDLDEVGSSVVRQLAPESPFGIANTFPGDLNSYIRGAAGVDPGSTTALTVWALAKIRSDPTGRKSVLTRNHATWGGWPNQPCALVIAASGAWYAEIGRVTDGYTEMRTSVDYALDTVHLFGLTYDGTTLRAWLDGEAAGSASAAGEIDWGPGTGKWEIGSNGGGERPVSTIYRAGVEEAVWDASTWAAFARSCAGLG